MKIHHILIGILATVLSIVYIANWTSTTLYTFQDVVYGDTIVVEASNYHQALGKAYSHVQEDSYLKPLN